MKKRITKIASIIFAGISASILLSGCSKNVDKDFKEFADFNENGIVIGTNETLGADSRSSQLFPNAKLEYYTDFYAALNNLDSGKWDGVITSDFLTQQSIETNPYAYKELPGDIETYDVALGLSDSCKITNFKERVNEAISQLKASGKIEEMKNRWYSTYIEKTLPEFPTRPGAYTINCVTFGMQKPVSYFENNKLVGFDVELAMVIANALECNINIEAADYPAMLLGLQTGKYDMISANLYITNERRENFSFSEPYSIGRIKMLARNSEGDIEYKTLEDMENIKNMGVIIGGAYGDKVKERFPNANVVYVNTIGDAMQSLSSHKIDAFFHDDPVLQNLVSSSKGFGVASEHLFEENYAFLTNKTTGVDLKNEFNTWIAEYKSSGKQRKAYEFWTGSEEPKTFPFDELPGPNGTIKAGLFLDARPATFAYYNEYTGYPNEVMYEFCKDRGYKCTWENVSPDSFIANLVSNKIDIMTGFISYTEERAQKVDYTDTVSSGGVSVLVRRISKSKDKGFFESVKESFEKTFVKEQRYKMIFKGLGVTLLITFLGFILANILGACFCALALSKNKFAKAVANVYNYIIQGTPVVVILMVLYYIIFGNSRISGEFVAIIGFGLVSGSGLAAQFKGGIESVDKGQKEASLALGFTKTQTFFGIVVPQTARRILPGYFAELIALLKTTSIVGYISVIDLTRTGDIIRSATFEAFFPLIAVAIIYFVIVAILLFTMQMIQKALARKKLPKKEDNK